MSWNTRQQFHLIWTTIGEFFRMRRLRGTMQSHAFPPLFNPIVRLLTTQQLHHHLNEAIKEVLLTSPVVSFIKKSKVSLYLSSKLVIDILGNCSKTLPLKIYWQQWPIVIILCAISFDIEVVITKHQTKWRQVY